MRILFFGIYQIGVNALASLIQQSLDIMAVVTKPDTEIEQQPVAIWAIRNGLPVLQALSPKDPEFIAQIQSLHPDLIAVAGYHKLIPKAILDIPSWGTINLHGSLLPRYRGPSTWKWAIMNGETRTGVTVHMMTPELDNGDILAQRAIPISDQDTGGSLFEKISVVGAELLADTIERIEAGTVERRPQDENEASYYGYPTERDACINWKNDAEHVRNLVRGLNPRPGAWSLLSGYRLRIWSASVGTACSSEQPGTIVDSNKDYVEVAASTYNLLISEMSVDGEPRMSLKDLIKQVGINCGDQFSESWGF